MMRFLTAALALIAMMGLTACGANYVRGEEVDGLDNLAMSTGLDKKDLESLFDKNVDSLMNSAVVAKWKEAGEPPLVSIFPIANETSEHIRDSLDALLSKMETNLVNSGVVLMIDHSQQDTLIAEIRKQQGGEFDQSKSAEIGKQLGAKFFITGKVHSSSEKVDGEKRVQYFLFMKVVDIETGAIRWQNEADLTKGLVK
ncbi:MAG: penicillin-binding protein activator LpoB [Deltaproteobacteria bacterium]|nr:penicillin-binding protein activator LpoB [Deltaproteobacteria bacterium]